MERSGLEGLRVLDFTQVWAGPYCSMLLALNGAEVIKVESEKRPDNSRLFSVILAARYENKDESPLYHTLNCNKKDITLDLSKPEAADLARRIALLSDVVVENFRPGVMQRLGLDYEALRHVKPDIVYLSSSSRGSTGPEWDYAGYAPIFAGLGGVSNVTGHAGGSPSPISGRTDLIVGTSGFFAVLAALLYREKTGKGQYIDLSSSEAMTVLAGDAFMEYAINRRNPPRKGNRDAAMVPHNCYPCKGEDKWVSIAVGTDTEWKAFCGAVGRPQWANDERFSDPLSRKANEEELDGLIARWTKDRAPCEVMRTLQEAGVAAMPSFNAEELCQDPHLRQRGVFTELPHPVRGRQTVVGRPWILSGTPARITRHAPLFGEHNEYVFGRLLGLSREKIAQLREDKVIY